MNFDQLKEQWNNEDSNVTIPKSIEQLKESKHPIERIQKKMKKEFPTQVLAVIFIASFPFLLNFLPYLYTAYYISYTILVVISSYYLFRFYQFYKETEFYTGNTKNSLWKIYHELRLNMERYQSFGFLLLPHFLITLGMQMYSILAKKGKSLNDFIGTHQEYIILSTLVVTLIYTASVILWTKYVYGRHAKQLENILNEMDE